MLRFPTKRFAPRNFPRNNRVLVLRRLDHSLLGMGEEAMTVRKAAAMVGDSVAGQLQPSCRFGIS